MNRKKISRPFDCSRRKILFGHTLEEIDLIGELDQETDEKKWTANTKIRVQTVLESLIKEINNGIPGAIPPRVQQNIIDQALSAIWKRIFLMNMERLPPEMQEKVLQEVIKQKSEDTKRMGWDKIYRFITCETCKRYKIKEFLIRPSIQGTIICKNCGFNQENNKTQGRTVGILIFGLDSWRYVDEIDEGEEFFIAFSNNHPDFVLSPTQKFNNLVYKFFIAFSNNHPDFVLSPTQKFNNLVYKLSEVFNDHSLVFESLNELLSDLNACKKLLEKTPKHTEKYENTIFKPLNQVFLSR